jgi:hypothetical protein
MVRPAPKGILVFGAFLTLALGISGCSSQTQPKAAACTELIAAVDQSTTHLNDGLTNLASDPTGAEKSLAKGVAILHAAATKITNADVAKVAAGADSAVSALTTQVITEIESDGATNTKKVAALSTAVSASFADIRRLCG